MMVEEGGRNDLAIRVAWLYHDRGLTQQEVADRLGMSRSTVSRILTEAERDGLIRVVITQPLPETAALAEALIEKYGLDGAAVGPALVGESPGLAAAQAMARRLETLASSGGATIAAGWGRTIAMSARETRPLPTSKVTIIDAFGHTTTEATTAAVEVTNTLARKFESKVMHVPSPGFADSEEVARYFLATKPVNRTLKKARAADLVLVSIGIVGPESLLVAEGFMSEEAMDTMIAKGAVGEVFGRYYSADGEALPCPDVHPVALTMDDLRSAKRVVAVAAGAEKTSAVKGAIAAGILDEIVVDETLANGLLA